MVRRSERPRSTGSLAADPSVADEALALLWQLTGSRAADFRPNQLEAIDRLVGRRERVLLVQRTGWGKSAVYFIATKMLRDRGSGPTLLVSPLLALMRNQIEAATRMGVRAETINSVNREDWGAVRERLMADEVDLLLVSPERLANPEFRSDVLPEVGARSGLLVVDEAHCISDWGHDFRPDYRRITRVLELLPPGVPVLCCTATANDRVVADVAAQLGSGLVPLRGPLRRDGLQMHALQIPSQAERLTWLAHVVPRLEGTGIVYCLTVADTERVAEWLRTEGVNAIAYSGSTDSDERKRIEQDLLSNDVKVVVATSALGMGFDKPDLAFVIHYQSPGSPIAYYQQVGRAGRDLAESWGILLSGAEDADIQDYFIRSAFPPPELAEQVVGVLREAAEPMTLSRLLGHVNVQQSVLEKLLKNLEVDGAVERVDGGWQPTLRPWSFDSRRVEQVTDLRRAEQAQMRDYICAEGCRMRLLSSYLDDAMAGPCGMCDNCASPSSTEAVDPAPARTDQLPHVGRPADEGLGPRFEPATVQRAVDYLRRAERSIEPRQRLPIGGSIPIDQRLERGRALSVWGDGGWGNLIRTGKQSNGRFDDRLVNAAADLIRDRWLPEPAPSWVTFVPSRRNPGLVADFAARLARELGLPCEDVVAKVRNTKQQKLMQNSSQQYRNLQDAFEIRGRISSDPVLLVDDIVDSRWTMTVVGIALREAGSGVVFPFALADAAGRSGT